MKEEYLQQIWKTKRLPFHQLITINHEFVEIIDTGEHNLYSGPDFFNARVRINGIMWIGNIEIHVCSSDWYAHRHHIDKAYDNVILHVVYEYDKPVFVKGRELPVLELKSCLDTPGWNDYLTMIRNRKWIPCESYLQNLESVFIVQQTDNACIKRISRKSEEVEAVYKRVDGDLLQLEFEWMMQAFGNKVNVIPFRELASRIRWEYMKMLKSDQLYVLMLGVAGLIDKEPTLQQEWNFLKHKYDLDSMESISWSYKGVRPVAYPERKIKQAASFFSVSQPGRYLTSEYHRIEEHLDCQMNNLPEAAKRLLAINGVVPLMWWYGQYTGKTSCRENAVQLLSGLKPEKNTIIDAWKKRGVKVMNAMDTQGLIETKNRFCDKRRCLQCKIGERIFRNTAF